jgi:ketosteroid isomerase-like protein
MGTFLGLHADDVVVHVVGRNAFSGDFKGKEAVANLFQRQMEALDSPPHFELHDILANDDHGVILGTQQASRGGRTLETKSAVILHIQDGKAQELWVMSMDPYAEDDFLS